MESIDNGTVDNFVLLSHIKDIVARYPVPTREEVEKALRLKKAQGGFLFLEDGLYAIDKNGDFIKNKTIDFLAFDKNGKYTSGSEELDDLVWNILLNFGVKTHTREELLRMSYEYVRDNIRYVGFSNHNLSVECSDGENGWMVPIATKAFSDGVGNCYYFAAAFTALARNLGYQAYAVGGIIGAAYQPHGWVVIVGEDGTVYMFDPETEYAKKFWEKKEVDLYMKTHETIGERTGLSYTEQNTKTVKDIIFREENIPEKK